MICQLMPVTGWEIEHSQVLSMALSEKFGRGIKHRFTPQDKRRSTNKTGVDLLITGVKAYRGKL